MKCPKCGNNNSFEENYREFEEYTETLYECYDCGKRWWQEDAQGSWVSTMDTEGNATIAWTPEDGK